LFIIKTLYNISKMSSKNTLGKLPTFSTNSSISNTNTPTKRNGAQIALLIFIIIGVLLLFISSTSANTGGSNDKYKNEWIDFLATNPNFYKQPNNDVVATTTFNNDTVNFTSPSFNFIISDLVYEKNKLSGIDSTGGGLFIINKKDSSNYDLTFTSSDFDWNYIYSQTPLEEVIQEPTNELQSTQDWINFFSESERIFNYMGYANNKNNFLIVSTESENPAVLKYTVYSSSFQPFTYKVVNLKTITSQQSRDTSTKNIPPENASLPYFPGNGPAGTYLIGDIEGWADNGNKMYIEIFQNLDFNGNISSLQISEIVYFPDTVSNTRVPVSVTYFSYSAYATSDYEFWTNFLLSQPIFYKQPYFNSVANPRYEILEANDGIVVITDETTWEFRNIGFFNTTVVGSGPSENTTLMISIENNNDIKMFITTELTTYEYIFSETPLEPIDEELFPEMETSNEWATYFQTDRAFKFIGYEDATYVEYIQTFKTNPFELKAVVYKDNIQPPIYYINNTSVSYSDTLRSSFGGQNNFVGVDGPKGYFLKGTLVNNEGGPGTVEIYQDLDADGFVIGISMTIHYSLTNKYNYLRYTS
jgi:hypothetical protein